jgi:REP element-mobilizing transposase RayT
VDVSRPLRFIPEGCLVEVTCRTLHGRFLLRPSRDLNEIAVGILARAARLYEVRVVAFVVLSNHAHFLLVPRDAGELASFMGYVNGNLAREAGRLHGWRERLWGRRYTAIVVSDEEEAQVERLRYLLAQGCKEGLVRSPRDWPGASSTEALLIGGPLAGLWLDRTAEYEARRRGERPTKYEYADVQSFELASLPVWQSLAAEEARRRVQELVRAIERETRAALEASGRVPLGARRILALDPHAGPSSFQRSPAPRFHAASWPARKSLEVAYHLFRRAFRQAAEALRRGLRAVFPPGCFAPRLGFLREGHSPSIPKLLRVEPI